MTPVAAVLLRRPDGRLLLGERLANDGERGAWGPPGGKVAPGEDVIAAGQRELEEETGLRLATSRLRPFPAWSTVTLPGGAYLVAWLCADLTADEADAIVVAEPSKCGAWLWCSRAEAEALPGGMFGAIVDLLARGVDPWGPMCAYCGESAERAPVCPSRQPAGICSRCRAIAEAPPDCAVDEPAVGDVIEAEPTRTW